MTIRPDTKDWTWVLERPCPDCGYDTRTLTPSSVPGVLRDLAALWPAVLARPDARDRPAPEAWSPLEYGCHVRDVFERFNQRLGLMLREDDPLFDNWDQDATALERRYREQDPAALSAELEANGELLAAGFDAVPDGAWDRPARRSDGAVFTVDTLARYLVHDPVHHLHDVGVRYPAA